MVHSARWQNLITNFLSSYQVVLARVECFTCNKIQHSALPSDLFFVKADDMNCVLDFFLSVGNTSENMTKIILQVMKTLLDLIFRLENVTVASNFSFSLYSNFRDINVVRFPGNQ